MLQNLLPPEIYTYLTLKSSTREISEIRVRNGMPIIVLCNLRSYFLTPKGISSNISEAIYATADLIESIIFKASDYSIYSVNEQIKQGYILFEDGIRIGVCGDVVLDGNIKTIKNFSSLCIRIPHLIKNVSLPIFSHVLSSGEVNNTLIISPPGAGKTTMLRDLIYQFSSHNYAFNIFIADEKGEISSLLNKSGCSKFFDAICYLNKKDAMMFGIRNMNPDIIVTDEIGVEQDYEALLYALSSGVKVIATMHAHGIEDLKSKAGFKPLLEQKYFKRIVVLSKSDGVCTIEGVYRENLTRIYGGTL